MLGPQFMLYLCIITIALLSSCCVALYEQDEDVHTFANKSEFKSKVLDSDGVWLVQFYAPWCGHCKNLQPTWSHTASMLKGIVNLGAVDAATEGPQMHIAASYAVGGFPTIQIFGADKQNPEEYNGQRNAQSLIQTALDNVVKVVSARVNESIPGSGGGSQSSKDSKVVGLNGSNFQEKVLNNPEVSMVAFIAPWCGHCKALLPEWETASTRLEGKGAFLGTVDATTEQSLAQEYGVEGFPTIKIFPGGANKSHSDARDYHGGRSAQDIVSAALDEVDRTGVPKEIPEITGDGVFKETCEGSNKICVLVGLPHILDSMASGRNKYKETIAAVAKKFRGGGAFEFFWFEGGSQFDLEDTLELTFGFPAVVAVSLDKNAYVVLRGSFNEKSVSRFLTSISTGRQGTVPLRKIPEIADVEPWDGLDGTPIEEEPLEDIMGWDDEDEL
uniref:protein disulfide-isomerase n=1 Tax=Ditylum brightwellii TaxID=49249 RepID=A0A7S1ZV28_9STRA|mmetsp:Transcript_39221/g.58945  ORF Transcript_39221/g.58945 Transcript_39221/m.58945 type:complete len:444 (+) Transcript_39221:58-1389(+)